MELLLKKTSAALDTSSITGFKSDLPTKINIPMKDLPTIDDETTFSIQLDNLYKEKSLQSKTIKELSEKYARLVSNSITSREKNYLKN